ncbi:DUF2254 domain-containing protein [Desulfuromonas sp. TF]|uniref:DUF2254 domain-containing protein n=1 Tax=Desulfuromonas sp. TF TaxID=1232410 RepID=UPI0003F88A37|nr:DUF2254 domain-containing protein [Desulfuromonas sp. TF]
MRTKLLNLWEKLRSSYWFIPSLMAIGAVALSFGALTMDRRLGAKLIENLRWFPAQQAEGSRLILSTVAGATITVTGVVFSVTIVALSLASQQFGPRLLSNFMRDRSNQFVFGTFIATYLYCLLVLRTIHGSGQNLFIPQISILIAFLLAVFSVGILIFFIHHAADSIQAMTVISNVSGSLHHAIERQFSDRAGELDERWQDELAGAKIPGDFEEDSVSLRSDRYGYIQAIDEKGLFEMAREKKILLRLECRPGHFVVRGETLAKAWPAEKGNLTDLSKSVGKAFIFGSRRSPEQDIEFLIKELVEVAVRALSPGINDPFTAISCIDHLGSALREMVERVPLSSYRFDGEDNLRLIAMRPDIAGIVDAAFDQIRQHGRTYASVVIRLLETIAAILPYTHGEEQRQPLLRQAVMIERGSESLPEAEDRKTVHARFLRIFQVMEERFGLSGEAG